MTSQEFHRNELLNSLDHLESVANKLPRLLGKGGVLTFPDHQKLSEGIFLSAWTQWEQFIRQLLIDDLAENPQSFVRKDVREFRVNGAPRRIAERILFHPDHPQKFVEWDIGLVRTRANDFLPTGHRFTNTLTREVDIEKLKRIRNAVAHKSDRARNSFLKLVADPPFNLTKQQRQGITVGRFLTSNKWNGNWILFESFEVYRSNAYHLVP